MDENEAQPTLWVPDHAATNCAKCDTQFWIANRKHHCRYYLLDFAFIESLQPSLGTLLIIEQEKLFGMCRPRGLAFKVIRPK